MWTGSAWICWEEYARTASPASRSTPSRTRGWCVPGRACPRILGYSRRSGGGSLREAKPSRMRLRRRAGTLSMYSLMSLASREPFAREAEDGDPISRFLRGAFDISGDCHGPRDPPVGPIDITYDARGVTIMASHTVRRRSPTRTVYLGSSYLASPKKAIWGIGPFMSVMKKPWFLRGTVLFSGQGAYSSLCYLPRTD